VFICGRRSHLRETKLKVAKEVTMQKQEFKARISPQGTIELPKHLSGLTNHQVRVVLYDIGSKALSIDKGKYFGALHQYANHDKASMERDALATALKQKHDTH
jgi:hypothetical protein